MGVAPLVAYYFGRFSTYFLLTNFIVLPAASLILYLTPVVMLVPSLAYLLLYIAGWLNRILAWVASLPGASIDHLHPSVIQVTMAYVVIAALWLLVQRVGRIRRAA
jgi:competence protein ComEC